MAFRRPDVGWHSPLAAVARDASVTAPHFAGSQDSVKRCQARSATGSSRAGCQDPPSTLISTWPTPPSAQAQPQISVALEALMAASGAGATIADCGAIAQTGTVRPLADAHSPCTGSLYQCCVKGPDARAPARVTRVSHLPLFVPYKPATTQRP